MRADGWGGSLNKAGIENRATAPGPSSGGVSRDHARLLDAAQQFEAMLLQQMLKPFAEADSGMGEKADDEGSSSSTLGSFGTEAVAKAISKGGGLGIARQIVSKVMEEKKESLEKAHNAKVSLSGADKLT